MKKSQLVALLDKIDGDPEVKVYTLSHGPFPANAGTIIEGKDKVVAIAPTTSEFRPTKPRGKGTSRRIWGMEPGRFYDAVMTVVEPKLTREQIDTIHFNYYQNTGHGNFWVGSPNWDTQRVNAKLVSSIDICAEAVLPSAQQVLRHFGKDID